MIKKQSTDTVFDQVNVRLSDAAHRDGEKNTNFRWAFDVNIVRCLYFLEYR